jgi:hypothetical protein
MKKPTIKEFEQQYNENPIEFLKPIEEKIGGKIVSTNFIEDTMDFKALMEALKGYEFKVYRYVEPFTIMTLVEKADGFHMKVHSCITFILPDDSLMRISPSLDNKLEISRLEVNIPGNELGELMINFLYSYCGVVIGYEPATIIEITGALGIGKNQKITPIAKQMKFFKKMGFEVIENDGVAIVMERPMRMI